MLPLSSPPPFWLSVSVYLLYALRTLDQVPSFDCLLYVFQYPSISRCCPPFGSHFVVFQWIIRWCAAVCLSASDCPMLLLRSTLVHLASPHSWCKSFRSSTSARLSVSRRFFTIRCWPSIYSLSSLRCVLFDLLPPFNFLPLNVVPVGLSVLSLHHHVVYSSFDLPSPFGFLPLNVFFP